MTALHLATVKLHENLDRAIQGSTVKAVSAFGFRSQETLHELVNQRLSDQ